MWVRRLFLQEEGDGGGGEVSKAVKIPSIILYWMQDHHRQAHSSFALVGFPRNFRVVVLSAKPSSPQIAGKESIRIVASTAEDMFTWTKDTSTFTMEVPIAMVHASRQPLLPNWCIVEDLVGVLARPVAVEVYRQWSVDRLEAILKCNRRWVHLREHGMLVRICLLMHQ